GHDESVCVTALRAQTHTADAGGDAKALPVTMSDASSGSPVPRNEDKAAPSETMLPASADAASQAAPSEAKADDTAAVAAKRAEASTPDARPGPSGLVGDARPAETTAKPQDANAQDITARDTGSSAKAGAKPDAARTEPAKAA